ncbi:hypothetical protein PR003_g10567 [Phytophthora rubi]|uniref:ZSWIM1/3 RNaseH-like domain-containing protein n=1 Tax=Phytophthora rubi TaxID=129364 RepID=A0A6A3MIE5_9STRA|nr:hypothetical protein PR002_g10429 [Phytophthora rubi]KAE9033209.1 hypothetical protein PR001_g10267 [Phytophthora rubi]KAE9340286.1 hypothetical protein PR003_g10567 [Phytophthora rubi]
MHKVGALAKGILAYLREQSGKLVALRDVHNMIQRFKTEQKAGLKDAEHAHAILDEFSTESQDNVDEMMVNADSKVSGVIAFQYTRMKWLYCAFPELVLVDATHDTNTNRHKLFSFAVRDGFGKSKEKANLRLAAKCFRKRNSAWANVRVIVTDKAIHEKAVLHEYFPKTHQVLGQWHEITWLKKQVSRLAPAHKQQVKGIVKSLIYERSSQEYQDAKGAKDALLETLGWDDEDPMYQ